GAARGDDGLRIDSQRRIDQQAGEVLKVMDLPTPVSQMCPALLTRRVAALAVVRIAVTAGVLAAREMEAPSRVRQDDIAVGGEPCVVPVVLVGAGILERRR